MCFIWFGRVLFLVGSQHAATLRRILLFRSLVEWDVDQADVETEGRVGLDIAACACAIAQSVGHDDFGTVAATHTWQGDTPALDGVVEGGAEDAFGSVLGLVVRRVDTGAVAQVQSVAHVDRAVIQGREPTFGLGAVVEVVHQHEAAGVPVGYHGGVVGCAVGVFALLHLFEPCAVEVAPLGIFFPGCFVVVGTRAHQCYAGGDKGKEFLHNLSELYLRSLGSLGLGLELRFCGETENTGPKVRREAFYGNVVFFNNVGIASALGGDAVFGAFELGLQAHELFVCLKVRVGLANGVHVDAECALELVLCLVEGVEALGVGGRSGVLEVAGLVVGVAEAGAGAGHVLVGAAFVFGVAFDGLDKVGDEVHTALVLHLDLGPGLVDVLFEGDHVVVGRFAVDKQADGQDDEYDDYDYRFFHIEGRFLAELAQERCEAHAVVD